MSVVLFRLERRRRRSNNSFEAIRLQLEHLHERLDLDALVLGDSNGLLLAGAGDRLDAEVLAAYAPLLSNRTERSRRREVLDTIRRMAPALGGREIAVRSFCVDGQHLLLGIVGDGNAQLHAALYRALTGVRRILDEQAQAA